MKALLKIIPGILISLALCNSLFGQNIGINTDGSAAEGGTLLDVKGSNSKASTNVLQNIFQIKSLDASTDALKLRLGLYTNSGTLANQYGVIDVPEYSGGSVLAYRHLALQPLGGNVGIGTTAPGAKLEVTGGSSFSAESGPIMATNTTVPAKKVSIGYDNAIDAGFISALHSGVSWKNLVLQPCLSCGNVGIGTTSPAQKLDVNGNIALIGGTVLTGAANMDVYGNIRVIRSLSTLADGMYIGYGSTGGPLRFYTNGNTVNTAMFIDNSGNVGINQSTPAAKLEVDGSSGSTIKIVDGNQAANKVLTSDATGQGSWQSLGSIGGSCFNYWELYATSGASGMLGTSGASSSYTFTVPAAVTLIKVLVWGGGGGGGGGGGFGINAGGGGGGGGGYAEGTFTVTPSSTYTVTIGNNGVGVAGANGTAGGTSSFVGTGINIQGTGGQGGSKPAVRTGGAGGVGSGGYLNSSLGNGGFGGQDDSGSATAGWEGTNGSGGGGAGGYGQAGYGGGGGGGGLGGGNGSNNANGMVAIADSGAGGGGGSGGGGTKLGGDGADGKVIVSW